MYTVHILNNRDVQSGKIENGFDISELVYDITHTTSLLGQAGKLTFKIKKDPNNILQIALGNIVKFWCDDIPVFYGHIFKLHPNNDATVEVLAYDSLRNFQNHERVTYDKNINDILTEICTQYRMPFNIIGNALKNPPPPIKAHFFNDVSIFEILQYALDETNRVANNGRLEKETDKLIKDAEDVSGVLGFWYFIRDNFGTIELNDIENNLKHMRTGIDGTTTKRWTGKEQYKYDEGSKSSLEPLVIGDESLLTGYDYTLDIDKDTFNEVMVFQTNTKNEANDGKTDANSSLIAAKQDAESIKKYGILRRIINLKGAPRNKAELDNFVKIALENGSQPSKTLQIKSLGYVGVNAGDGFLLRLKKLNIEQMVYVLSATHNYRADCHTMELDVATNKSMIEILGATQ